MVLNILSKFIDMYTIKYILLFSSVFILGCSAFRGNPEEKKALDQAMKINTLAALDAFLENYPETIFKEVVADRRETILFGIAINEKTEYHLNKYLQEFPQGKRKENIQNELDVISKLTDKPLSIDDLNDKTFVGSIHYLDEKPAHIEILTLNLSNPEINSEEISFNANVHLGLDLKKELKVIIEKNKMSIKFVELESDEFLLELPEGRFYKINNQIIVESVIANSSKYWILK